MFEPYYLYFNIKKMQRYKQGLEAYKNNSTYLHYDEDKKKANEYIHKFMINLVKDGSNMVLDSYKGDLGTKIENLGREINKNKKDINAQDVENQAQDFNEAQEFLYGTGYAKNEVNEMVTERNELINTYNNPRPALKAMIIDKLSSSIYENVDLDELSEAIINGDLEYFEKNKDLAEKIDPLEFAGLYNDIFSSNFVETALNNIPEPNLSYEIYKYSVTEEVENDLIDGLISEKQLNNMESVYYNLKSVEEGAEYQEEANDKKFLGERIEKCKATMKAFEDNGKALRSAIGGLDPVIDREVMESRIERFIASIACGNPDDMQYKPVGMDEDSYANFEEVGKYVQALIEKSDAFGARAEFYLSNLDINKITKNAQAKYEGKIKDAQAKTLGALAVADGSKEIEDGKKIYELINNSNNPKAAFNDLINNCLNGTSNLYPYNNRQLEKTAENIGNIVNYITQQYNAHKLELSTEIILDEDNNPVDTFSLNDHGITNEYIKSKCDSLVTPEAGAKNMLLKFNDELNLYNVIGEELQALNDPSRSANDKNLLKALAQTEGLNVPKESEKLNDAIATYGRMKEIHANRGSFYWLFHPILNYRENQVINTMKQTLVEKYKFTDAELNARVNELAGKSTDAINKACLRLSNPEEYKNIVKSEKENRADRNKIIADQLENIDKYGQREKPRELGPDQEVIYARALKNGVVVDNVELSDRPEEKTFDEFLNKLTTQDALLATVLKTNGSVSPEEKLKRRDDAKIESIEKFVDYDGYTLDKNQETAETLEEIKNLKADLEGNDPKIKETIKFNEELNSINKEIRLLNSQNRIEKFNAMLDEYNDKEELKDIENASSIQEREEAEANYKKNHLEREERAENRKASEAERAKKINELNKKAEAMLIDKESKELSEEYNKTFNSLDDTSRSNVKSNAEKSSMDAFSKKFNLTLNEELEEENVKEEIQVNEEKKVVENENKLGMKK